MHMTKCITIHLLLGNIRPRIRYRKMQILWSFQGASQLDLHQDSTMELLGACSARIHSNVLRNDRRSLHVVPTTWYGSQTKRQKKYDWGGGGRHQSGCLPSSFTPTMPLIVRLYLVIPTSQMKITRICKLFSKLWTTFLSWGVFSMRSLCTCKSVSQKLRYHYYATGNIRYTWNIWNYYMTRYGIWVFLWFD